MDLWEERHGAASGEGDVARIVCASRALVRGSVFAEMEAIRASALKHNAPAGIATALLYQSGWFVHWKEGSGEALRESMERIADDPRHYDLRVVHRSRGPRLLAGPWSMAIVQGQDSGEDMERRLHALQREVEVGARYTPPAVWRRLSTPLAHPGALRQQDADAFQRVLVCAAEGNGSFSLAAWLGQRHEVDVVHRRFAGAHEHDVGTDYVDFPLPGRFVRVIAMARHGLNVPLTRAFLPDYSHIVLLLAEEPDANVQLMARVLSALRGVEQPPVLIGVGATPLQQAEPAALAARFHLAYEQAQVDPENAADCWEAVQQRLDAAVHGTPQ